MATSASGFVNNWQAGQSLAETNLRMLQEEDSCDVTFRCGTKGYMVKAHRYMLISRSCVFHAMLTGAMAEKSDIKIPDIEPPVFKTFLKYIYTENIDINADNVTALLYTGRKYGVTSLETKCTEFLEENLDPENACVILESAHRFDQKELYKKALSLIKSQGERSLQSPGFLALSQVLVDEIVGSDDLVVDEHVIFTAVSDWSEAECVREGRELTPVSKRSVLGNILMKVRFPLMKPAFLAKEVKKSKLLTETERIMCLEFSVAPEEVSTTFNQNQRKKMNPSRSISKRRFLTRRSFWIQDGRIDAFSFISNSNVSILGCQLYGSYNDNSKTTYFVTSYFGDEDNVLSRVVQERSEYTSEGEVFDVIFSRAVSVSAGEWYTLAVRIEGPGTWKGTDGQKKVVCDDGVELQFSDSEHSVNETNTSKGCQLYGKNNESSITTYYVTSYLGDKDNVLSVVQERSEYTSECEVFDVIFSRPVSVSAGEWYTLAVRIEGPGTWKGEGGQEKVVCDDGVELKFRDSRHSKNGTSTYEGQIPSLIYRKC